MFHRLPPLLAVLGGDGQPPEHEAGHRMKDVGVAGRDGSFVFLAEDAKLAEPSVRAFADPPFGNDLEAFDVVGAPDFVQVVSSRLGLKAQHPPHRIAWQRELLSIAAGQQQRDGVALPSIRGGGETHGDYRLAGDDVARRA